MYGYVRPFKPELKVCELERYRAAYCGLCHTLKKEYGGLARFAVSYDMAFAAMLLSGGENLSCSAKRCAASPFKKKCVMAGGKGFADAAALTAVLAWHKLSDEIADGGFFKALGCRMLRAAMRRKYKKAVLRCGEFAEIAEQRLKRLNALERENCSNLDAAADCFAGITAGFAHFADGERRQRVLRELFYHVGRAVYILDALDDLERDLKEKNYNPIAVRYGLSDAKGFDDAEVAQTIEQSLAAAAAALELLDEDGFSGIARNIIYLGMPAVLAAVRSGEKRKRNGRTL
jgi:hypothetical protein